MTTTLPKYENIFTFFHNTSRVHWRREATELWDSVFLLSQISKLMRPTWGPPGSWRPQMGPMLAPWTLLSGMIHRIWRGKNIKKWYCQKEQIQTDSHWVFLHALFSVLPAPVVSRHWSLNKMTAILDRWLCARLQYSSALAMELLQSCIKPSRWYFPMHFLQRKLLISGSNFIENCIQNGLVPNRQHVNTSTNYHAVQQWISMA